MSRYIATRAMRGANAIVTEAEVMLNKALTEKGADTPVSFPNTAYFLPTILGMTGKSVEKLGDLKPIVKYARDMLHPIPAFAKWTPYLGETLDSGMATLLAAETIEAVRFAYGLQPEPMPGFKLGGGTNYGGKTITGLANLVSTTPSTGTVEGLDRPEAQEVHADAPRGQRIDGLDDRHGGVAGRNHGDVGPFAHVPPGADREVVVGEHLRNGAAADPHVDGPVDLEHRVDRSPDLPRVLGRENGHPGDHPHEGVVLERVVRGPEVGVREAAVPAHHLDVLPHVA